MRACREQEAAVASRGVAVLSDSIAIGPVIRHVHQCERRRFVRDGTSWRTEPWHFAIAIEQVCFKRAEPHQNRFQIRLLHLPQPAH